MKDHPQNRALDDHHELKRTDGKEFIAHSGNKKNKEDWQTLKEHLLAVGKLAKEKAKIFHAGDFG